jgi:hypothetical protein
VLRYPVADSGDAPFYIDLAWNWLKNGVYGFAINGVLTPVDIRVPGYPAFLASIFAIWGRSNRPVMIAQAVLDLVTCFGIALIAAQLASADSRRRVTIAAIWLAALCPFIANYSTVILTETLCTFLAAMAILVLLDAFRANSGAASREARESVWNRWFLSGIVAGFGTLVRPETPLMLLAAGLVLVALCWKPADWSKLVRAGVFVVAGLILPLLPWAARNWRTLHEVQFLAPHYSELPGEFTPRGFSAWTRTWLWRFGDVYLSDWKVDVEEIPVDSLPSRAFDSDEEKAHVANVLDTYNQTLTLTRPLDAQFRDIANQRTARDPLRTWFNIPLLRSLTLWFTPRVELLPITGHLWPFWQQWDEDRPDFLVTLLLVAVNALYIGLALAGISVARKTPEFWFLIAFVLIRTLYIASFVETPEPRYVLECWPVVIAFGALAFSRRYADSSTGSG